MRESRLVNGSRTLDGLGFEPFVPQYRPQRLVQLLAVSKERPPQHPFLHGTQLPQRAVAAFVLERHARFEPMGTQHVKREIDNLCCAIDENARALIF